MELKRASSSGSATAALREALVSTVSNLTRDISRSKDVVKDAIARLFSSFTALGEMVNAQREMLKQVTGSLHAESLDQDGAFSGKAAALTRQYVDEMVRVSRDSVRILEQLANLGASVGTIVHRADGIEKLARETRLLALNARIETLRAGEAGRTFGVVADEVKRLSGSSAGLSEEIRNEVHTCHKALTETTKTAESLAAHDMNTALAANRALTDAINKLDEVNSTLRSTLLEIDSAIAAAIQALEFEDMVSQLLDGIGGQVSQLGDLMVQALDGLASPHAGEHFAKIASQLNQLRERTAVAQTSTKVGSIDRF